MHDGIDVVQIYSGVCVGGGGVAQSTKALVAYMHAGIDEGP